MAGKRGGLHNYTVQEGQNATLGQSGSIQVQGTDPITCLNGTFIAIQFLEDTVFNTLTAEDVLLWPSSDGESDGVSASGGAQTGSNVFPAGMTIYGRWTVIDLTSGAVIAYRG